MFGQRSGWGIANMPHTLYVVVGGIGEKPAVVDGRIEPREMLSLTLALDHDLVDGAPAARFARRLVELIESGYGRPRRGESRVAEGGDTVAPLGQAAGDAWLAPVAPAGGCLLAPAAQRCAREARPAFAWRTRWRRCCGTTVGLRRDRRMVLGSSPSAWAIRCRLLPC